VLKWDCFFRWKQGPLETRLNFNSALLNLSMPISLDRVRRVFQKLERDLVKLTGKHPGNSIHGFRTGTRRMQILLEELLPEHERNQRKLLKLLLKIRKRAGKVRDLDVQLAALRSLKTPQEPRRKTQLTHRLIELRAEHEKKLRKSLTKEDIGDIRKRLKRALKAVSVENGQSDETKTDGTKTKEPLAVAQALLAQIVRPGGPVPEDVLHQYRILGKRARYVAEFAAKSPEADQLVARLKRSQDALGDWHDWLLLQQTAADRLGDVRHSSLVAVLRNVTAAKFRRAVAALPVIATPAPAAKSAVKPKSTGSTTEEPHSSAA
jgi:CHAD domain-containing protein